MIYVHKNTLSSNTTTGKATQRYYNHSRSHTNCTPDVSRVNKCTIYPLFAWLISNDSKYIMSRFTVDWALIARSYNICCCVFENACLVGPHGKYLKSNTSGFVLPTVDSFDCVDLWLHTVNHQWTLTYSLWSVMGKLPDINIRKQRNGRSYWLISVFIWLDGASTYGHGQVFTCAAVCLNNIRSCYGIRVDSRLAYSQ